MASLAKHTVFNIGDGMMSEAFTQVVGVTDISSDGVSWDLQDVTSHDSADKAKRSQPTLYTNGTIKLTILYDPNEANHALIRTLSTTGAAHNYQVVHVNSIGTDSFSGFVTAFSFDTPVGGMIVAKVTVMIDGAFA